MSDTVSRVDDVTDLGLGCFAGLVRLDEILECVTDLVRADREFCHFCSFS